MIEYACILLIEKDKFKEMKTFKSTLLLSLLIAILSFHISYGDASDWAQDDISTLDQHNILPNHLNNHSKFQDKITRAEFTELMVNLYTHLSQTPLNTISQDAPFEDTNNLYIGAAYNIGLVNGISTNEFAPNNYITRQEIVCLIARELRVLGINTAPDQQAQFNDMNQVAEWAKADISYCVQEGILKGMGNNLVAPLNNATREQAICIVERVRADLWEQQTDLDNSVPDEITKLEHEIITLINKERMDANLEPFNHNIPLSCVARAKSQDMVDAGYFNHTSPTYGSPFDMMDSFGIHYGYAAENIAMGQQTPEAVVKSWMNSEGHRKNILNPNYTDLGVGLAKTSSGTPYWTQMFISN